MVLVFVFIICFLSDTVGARALAHNAVDLHPSLPRGNLTVDACVGVCAANNFTIAGVEFGDECCKLLSNALELTSS